MFIGYAVVALKIIQMKYGHPETAMSTPDVKLCLQFFIILFCWLTMSVAWLFAPKRPPGAYILTFATALNYGCNPAVYFIFNSTIRKGMINVISLESIIDYDSKLLPLLYSSRKSTPCSQRRTISYRNNSPPIDYNKYHETFL